jgi:hypothetical protein
MFTASPKLLSYINKKHVQARAFISKKNRVRQLWRFRCSDKNSRFFIQKLALFHRLLLKSSCFNGQKYTLGLYVHNFALFAAGEMLFAAKNPQAYEKDGVCLADIAKVEKSVDPMLFKARTSLGYLKYALTAHTFQSARL